MMKGIATPSMGKDSIAWGGMVGMSSALMAQRGFTGVEPLFEDAPDPQWVAGLGADYEILKLYFKPYACCRWAQPAIAGALRLARQHRIEPAEIESINLGTFEAATRLSRAHPQNTEEAQYNLSFPVAAALTDGELGPRQVLPPRIYDASLVALADRVVASVEPRHEAAFPARAVADVEVITRSGATYRVEDVEAPWQPPSAPQDDELTAKFHWLVAPLLGEQRADEISNLVWRLHRLEDVRDLVGLCVPVRGIDSSG